MAHLLRSFDPLFYGDADINAQSFGYCIGLRHDLGGQGARLRALDDLDERGARERADRIERDVAHQLHPHVVPDVRADWTPETGFDESVGDAPEPFALRSVRLANCEARPFDVFDDSRLRDDRRRIDHTPDRARRVKMAADHAARINRLQTRPLPGAAVTIEIPPGDAVLRADNTGLRPQKRRQARGHL